MICQRYSRITLHLHEMLGSKMLSCSHIDMQVSIKLLHGSKNLMTLDYLLLFSTCWRKEKLYRCLKHIINRITIQKLQGAQQIPCTYF